MEFVEGEMLVFNADAEDYRYIKGNEYEVVGVETNIILVLDSNKSRVAWTKQTASTIFLKSNLGNYEKMKARVELLESELTIIKNTLYNVNGADHTDNFTLRRVIERAKDLLGEKQYD